MMKLALIGRPGSPLLTLADLGSNQFSELYLGPAQLHRQSARAPASGNAGQGTIIIKLDGDPCPVKADPRKDAAFLLYAHSWPDEAGKGNFDGAY